MKLATSIRNRQHCSPEILSDHLHEALQDLNTAVKSQPKLFLGSKTNQSATNKRAGLAAVAQTLSDQTRKRGQQGVSLSSVKTDSSALLEWKSNKRASEQAERKTLRPQLSKMALTSFEFSEALPLAAFASLLVEMVARLDNVIEEVEELGRIAGFKDYNPDDDTNIVITSQTSPLKTHLPSNGSVD